MGNFASPHGYPQPALTKGSVGLGFLAGFFGSCIGLALVFALAKGPETKKGATIGFAVVLAFTVLGNLISVLVR